MAGVAGASIGLNAGQQTNIAPAQALVDGSTTSKGCTTNFIGFGFGLGSEELDPNDFSAADDTVVRALAASGTVQTPGYTAVSGSSPPRSTLAWTTGAAAAAPTNSVAPTITGTAQVASTLTAVNGTWAGTPTPTYSYEWRTGATVVAGVATGGTIVGSNTGTYVCATGDIGKTVTVKVTGRNPAGTLTVAAVATAAVIA
jgi:hypothetical protein